MPKLAMTTKISPKTHAEQRVVNVKLCDMDSCLGLIESSTQGYGRRYLLVLAMGKASGPEK